MAIDPPDGHAGGTTDLLFRPSPELARITGPEALTRAAINAKLWEYINAHGLKDAKQ